MTLQACENFRLCDVYIICANYIPYEYYSSERWFKDLHNVYSVLFLFIFVCVLLSYNLLILY